MRDSRAKLSFRTAAFAMAMVATGWAVPLSWTAPAAAEAPQIRSPFGAYLAGLSARHANDLSVAADYMLHALEGDPENPELLRPVFLLAAADGRYEEAEDLGRRLIAMDASNVIVRTLLSMASAKRADWKEAQDQLAAMPTSGIATILSPMLSSWLHFADGDREAAQARLEELKNTNGLSLLVHMHEALMLDLAGDEGAEAAYERALAAAERPTLRLAWLAGNYFERAGKAEKADALYRQISRRTAGSAMAEVLLKRLEEKSVPDPLVSDAEGGLAESLFNVASLLFQERVEDVSLILLHQALRLRDDFPAARLLLGEVLETQGRSEEAIAAYRSIGENSSYAWVVRLRVAENFQDLGRVEDAIAELDRLAAERPQQYEPLFRKGNILRVEEQFEDAVMAYDEAFERLGDSRETHWSMLYYRGIALERSKQWDRAEADFLKALELEPDQPFVLNYLAYSWIELRLRLEEAKEMLVRAVELRPRDGYIVDSLGWAHYRLGDYQDAVVQLEKAVELQPQDPVINDHLGDAYWRTGRRAEARFQWRRALSLEPEEKEAVIIERKLREGMPPPEDDQDDT